MNPSPESYADIITLGSIAFFGLLSSILIVREGRLGWAMFVKNVTYACAFGYAAARMLYPELSQHEWIAQTIHAAIITALLWASYELIYARYLLWKEGGISPRELIGRRERVVGRREVVATRREDVVEKREDAVDTKEA